MIPRKNKKNLEANIEEIRNLSFSYLEKYSASKQQLRTYLLKKYFKSPGSFIDKKELLNLIDFVILDLEKNKLISDKFYSDSKSRSFVKRGYSIRKIRNYLIQKGIENNYIQESISKIISNNSDQDFFSAIKLCKKKRIGPCRSEDNRVLFYKKDISILARGGFDYETSKKVMDLSKDDFENFLKLS
ncbi:MAG: regulatory protein RecX [Candidatus Pelagibacterales bacterium]|nr:MAG: regulatory protein RecX [Pelagibacteraceae bacterium TMED233]RZO61530.1 MAG: regulatory protein RecX [Pelagibacterales bacterium]|tara:strand:+ start:138 stop:698 length:561 start_codon:yes stop_codon:yes gene_type:complete